MSLNDNVLDDLNEDTIIDNDVIKQPDNIKDIDAAPDVAEDVPETEDKLVDVAESLEELSTRIDTIDDLEELENQILANESISQSDAMNVNDVFNDIMNNNRICIEEFTKIPSRTNYSYITSKMHIAIEKEKDNLCTSFKSVIDVTVSVCEDICKKLIDTSIDAAITMVINAREEHFEIIDSLKDNKNLVVELDRSFVNIFKLDLELLDFAKLSTPVIQGIDSSKDKRNLAVSSIKKALGSKRTKAFIYSCLNNEVLDITDMTRVVKYSDTSVTLSDLSDFIKSTIVVDYLADIDNIAIGTLKTITEISDQCDKYHRCYNDAAYMLNEKSAEIQSILSICQSMQQVVYGVTSVTSNTTELLNYLKHF